MHPTLIAGALGAGMWAGTTFADEFRVRFVNPWGTEERIVSPGTGAAHPAPNGRARLRLQIGVFDDAEGPAPAGGVWGWSPGFISVSGSFTTPMDVYRTPGRLAPFVFSSSPFANGEPTTDPFTAIGNIDATLRPQVVRWPPRSDPEAPPPPPPPRGLNTFVSVYEVTLELDEKVFHEMRVLNIDGDLHAARGWVAIQTVPPKGEEWGFVEYYPILEEPVRFSFQQSVIVERFSHCEVDFDFNGVVDSRDFFEFLSFYFSRNPMADVNRDGAIGSQDFFDFLTGYFAGC